MFIIIFILFPFLCLAQDLAYNTRLEGMLCDLEFVKNVLQNNYALTQWKQERFGWSLQDQFKEARDKLLGLPEPGSKPFQQVIKTFLKSTRDYHVEVVFFSTEMASLPFSVEKVGERYFISSIDEEFLQTYQQPLAVGDELIQFDGLPVDTAVKQFLAAGNHGGNEESDLALAKTFLTSRYAWFGHEVPSGTVTFTTRCFPSSVEVDHKLEWEYTSEQVQDPRSLQRRLGGHGEHNIALPTWFQKNCMLPGYELIADNNGSNAIGERNSILPALGKKIWETANSARFQAYIFLHKGRRVGFVRIPTYFEEDSDEAVKDFAAIINAMQANADCLIIDQMSNPGGNLLYLYALVSMLSDEPLSLPKHRIALTQEDLYFAIQELPELEKVTSDREARELLGKTIQGIPVTLELVKGIRAHLQFMLDEWNAGRQLTEPSYLLGIGPIAPYPKIRFTKPILVLVNRLDFSGGDFFPAILQDNKRALIMGTPTAGAGGYLHKVTFPNMNGISYFSYTVSMAERIDQQPIENLGVTPDIYYEVSENDLHFNYEEFSNAILRVVEQICPVRIQQKRRLGWKSQLSRK